MAKRPAVEMCRPFGTDDTVYAMRVSDQWLIDARWPRLTLSWWLVRLVWVEMKVPKRRWIRIPDWLHRDGHE